VSEAGLSGYEATIWLGLVAPTGTPKDVVAKLNTEINKILNSAEAKASWAKFGSNPLVMSAAQFNSFVTSEIEKWAKIVQISGAKI
jgi:tripartite-type tricarboxylate transporter receptor subunit TctC